MSPSDSADCDGCPFQGRPMVPGYGAPPQHAKAVIVGESPGRTEAQYLVPFVGPSGRLLRSALTHAGFTTLSCKDAAEGDLEEGEIYYTNAALCLPIGGDIDQYKTSQKKKKAAKMCFKRLKAEILPYAKAGVPFCAVGGAASLSMVGNEAITKIRSQWHVRDPVKILTTWHPAYILRQPVRVGELVRDIKKLHHGGPIWDELGEYVAGVERGDSYRMVATPADLAVLVSDLEALAAQAEGEFELVLDIESDNVDWWKDQILCYGLAWELDQAAIIPEEMVYTEETRDALIRLFDNPKIKWIGHNFKFDIRFIKYQTRVHNARVDYDTLIADHILDENRRHALKNLLVEFYDVPDYEADLVQRYLKNRNDRYSKVPRPQLYKYCVYDVIWTLLLWRDLSKQLRDKDLFDMPFMYPSMAMQTPLLDMELHGMLISQKQLQVLSVELRSNLQEIYTELCAMARVREFNPNSYIQVGAIMYDKLKMPPQRVRGLCKRSTAEPVRTILKALYTAKGRQDGVQYRWLDKYDGWKKMEKLRNSYVDNTIPLIDANNRVHPDILVYGTRTGRISVRNPALQTIPRKDTGQALGELYGQKIKQCYIVPPGYTMVHVDYSQAELRTVAWMSRDPFLLQCYMDDRDIHGEVADAFWPGWFELEDLILRGYRRKRTKMCVFGRLYLGTKYTVAETLKCTLKEAERYLQILDDKLGGLVAWEHEQLETLKRKGYVETLTKRRRRMPLVTRVNLLDARKAACNSPVQGTAADLLNISTIETYHWLNERFPEEPRPHMVITVHDSIILEVPDKYVKEVAHKVKTIMEEVAVRWMPDFPWKADIETGPSWGDLKEYEA